MKELFSVGYGSEAREAYIEGVLENDRSVAVILAAVHFEWTLKRTILLLGRSSTVGLKKRLSDSWSISRPGGNDLLSIWHEEIGQHIHGASLHKIVHIPGVLDRPEVKSSKSKKTAAINVREKIVQGNGTVKKEDAISAVNDYLKAAKNLRAFAKKMK